MSSEENLTDLLSRGVSVDTLKINLWWYDPYWLTNKQWPVNMMNPEINLPELKSTAVTLTVKEEFNLLRKFSRFDKLLRAYCKRFINNAIGEKITGSIMEDELQQAEITVVKLVQRGAFSEDLHNLKQGQELHRKSKLRAMDPFLDEEGLIRRG